MKFIKCILRGAAWPFVKIYRGVKFIVYYAVAVPAMFLVGRGWIWGKTSSKAVPSLEISGELQDYWDNMSEGLSNADAPIGRACSYVQKIQIDLSADPAEVIHKILRAIPNNMVGEIDTDRYDTDVLEECDLDGFVDDLVDFYEDHDYLYIAIPVAIYNSHGEMMFRDYHLSDSIARGFISELISQLPIEAVNDGYRFDLLRLSGQTNEQFCSIFQKHCRLW